MIQTHLLHSCHKHFFCQPPCNKCLHHSISTIAFIQILKSHKIPNTVNYVNLTSDHHLITSIIVLVSKLSQLWLTYYDVSKEIDVLI